MTIVCPFCENVELAVEYDKPDPYVGWPGGYDIENCDCGWTYAPGEPKFAAMVQRRIAAELQQAADDYAERMAEEKYLRSFDE